MATRAEFQILADELINGAFGDFKLPLLLEQIESDYATQSTAVIASDSTEGIKLDYTAREFNGSSIQVGDYQVILEAQGLSVNVRADNVNATFDGVDINIISVQQDTANATYTLQCRAK